MKIAAIAYPTEHSSCYASITQLAPHPLLCAPLAQQAEQEALNFKVGGSSPSRGTKRGGVKPLISVRIRVEAPRLKFDFAFKRNIMGIYQLWLSKMIKTQ